MARRLPQTSSVPPPPPPRKRGRRSSSAQPAARQWRTRCRMARRARGAAVHASPRSASPRSGTHTQRSTARMGWRQVLRRRWGHGSLRHGQLLRQRLLQVLLRQTLLRHGRGPSRSGTFRATAWSSSPRKCTSGHTCAKTPCAGFAAGIHLCRVGEVYVCVNCCVSALSRFVHLQSLHLFCSFWLMRQNSLDVIPPQGSRPPKGQGQGQAASKSFDIIYHIKPPFSVLTVLSPCGGPWWGGVSPRSGVASLASSHDDSSAAPPLPRGLGPRWSLDSSIRSTDATTKQFGIAKNRSGSDAREGERGSEPTLRRPQPASRLPRLGDGVVSDAFPPG